MIGYSRKPMDQMFSQRSIIQGSLCCFTKAKTLAVLSMENGDLAEIGGYINSGQINISSDETNSVSPYKWN